MTTQQITHSYIKENYTCENYHNDDRFFRLWPWSVKELIGKWIVNKYEIDPRTILPDGKPMVIRVQFKDGYNTFAYLNGYTRNDAIEFVNNK